MSKLFVADGTDVWSFSGVRADVTFAVVEVLELAVTLRAFKHFVLYHQGLWQ